MALACRACHININATYGCAICDPVRKQLIVVGEDEEDSPSLNSTAKEVVNALRAQLRHIKDDLRDKPDEFIATERRLIMLANSLSKVIDSARKIQLDAQNVIETMSFSEKAELFIGWIQELAPAYRVALREKWDEWETEAATPLKHQEARFLPQKAEGRST